jgi:hypothetical protein
MEREMPVARYFWPCSPVGELAELTFITLVSPIVCLQSGARLATAEIVDGGGACEKVRRPCAGIVPALCLSGTSPTPAAGRTSFYPGASALSVHVLLRFSEETSILYGDSLADINRRLGSTCRTCRRIDTTHDQQHGSS